METSKRDMRAPFTPLARASFSLDFPPPNYDFGGGLGSSIGTVATFSMPPLLSIKLFTPPDIS